MHGNSSESEKSMSEQGIAADVGASDVNAEFKLVRPTLFVGLGGTGAAILTALRRRIMQRLWAGHRLESLDDFKVASFLYFDTYSGQTKDQEGRRNENEPEDPIAPLVALQAADSIQAGLEPAKYLKKDPLRGTAELDSYPTVKEWLPAEELTAINLEEGAGQIRAMSRLLFFDRFADIYTQISSRVRQLQQNLGDKDKLRMLGLTTTDKVNVKIIGSAAGGTGSGTFIDAGYLASALMDPKPDEVSLWLVLGGAFSGQGPRVLANTYAALAELEYAMKLRFGDKPFVTSWDGRFKPDKVMRPYSRLYLFDSTNTAGIGVNQQGRDYIFRMIADVLLQEFAEPDLVGARRGDNSNQDVKYREPMYAPVVTRQFKGQGLEYSRLYSGIGQSIVETRGRIEFQAQSAEVAIGILKAYFRIDGSQAVAPLPAAVNDFLADKLFLAPAKQFNVHKDLRNPPVLSDFPLISSRLLAKDNASLMESVQNDLAADFQQLVLRPMEQWPERAQEIKKNRTGEIDQDPTNDRKALLARNVDDACRRLAGELTGADSEIRRGILALIDSETGGIAYAEQFVEALKSSISTRWIPQFKRDADSFGDLATKVLSQLYAQAEENLQKESRGGLMSRPNRQRMETILFQMRDTLTVWMQYRLRQIACTKAVDLLAAVNAALGDAVGVGTGGRPQYSGVLREIGEGQTTIEDAIADLDREAALIRDPDTARNPIHQVIGTASSAPVLSIGPEAYRALAVKAFENYGGATQVFLSLRDRRRRALILNRIKRVASEEIGPQGKPVLPAEADVPSLVDEMLRLNKSQQEEIIDQAVKQAMPWVNINKFEGYVDDMNTVYVCVAEQDRFEAAFGDMVTKAASKYAGAGKQVNYVPSDTKGKLMICTELSGLPLDAIKQLHFEWLAQYDRIREDNQAAPLHTQKDWEKFARPTAPDSGQMMARLTDLGLFIRGVGFGLLRRRTTKRFPTAPDKVGHYEINFASGLVTSNWVPIGRELKIRNFGLRNEHRQGLENALREFESELSSTQIVVAATLFEHFRQQHYAPRLVGSEEMPHAGMGHLAAGLVVDVFTARLKETAEGLKLCGADDKGLAAIMKGLFTRLDEWTVEVEDSLDDVDSTEANKDPNGDRERRARPKRAIRPEVFGSEEKLREIVAIDKPAVAPAAIAAAPAGAAQKLYWYVGPDGKPLGRLVDGDAIARLAGDGVIGAETKICARGTTLWREASSWPEFAGLFEAPPPLDETPPPFN
jgi:tubulin-like protein